MLIRGLTVCVNYSDLLAKSIALWRCGLNELIVVTTPDDKRTQRLCEAHGTQMHITDVFYANGAKFNKGAALSEAELCFGLRERHKPGDDDWILCFDSDIVPPSNWRIQLEHYTPQFGNLYGTYRWAVPETATKFVIHPKARRMAQGWIIGFFMLFHVRDKHLPPLNTPIFDIDWPHAGNYDTRFCRRWGKAQQIILPLKMIHLGEERSHWCGRNYLATMQEFFANRPAIEDYEHERMAVPPTLRLPERKS